MAPVRFARTARTANAAPRFTAPASHPSLFPATQASSSPPAAPPTSPTTTCTRTGVRWDASRTGSMAHGPHLTPRSSLYRRATASGRAEARDGGGHRQDGGGAAGGRKVRHAAAHSRPALSCLPGVSHPATPVTRPGSPGSSKLWRGGCKRRTAARPKWRRSCSRSARTRLGRGVAHTRSLVAHPTPPATGPRPGRAPLRDSREPDRRV